MYKASNCVSLFLALGLVCSGASNAQSAAPITSLPKAPGDTSGSATSAPATTQPASGARAITSLPKSPGAPASAAPAPAAQPAAEVYQPYTPAPAATAPAADVYQPYNPPGSAAPVTAAPASVVPATSPVSEAPAASAPAAAPVAVEAPLRASTANTAANGTLVKHPVHFLSTVAIGVNIGIGGVGAQLAVPLSKSTNFRVGGSFLGYSGNFTEDGINIQGDLKFRSATANLDWFPFHGGFHISPGVTVYNGNNLNALALVPAGGSFTLDDVQYTSSAADPVHGNASLTFGKRTAPNFTIGWGNMVPRSNRHWSVPFDVGFQYIGAPKIQFNLLGTACSNGGCSPIATDPTAQANLKAEQEELNSDIYPLRFYPIVTLGFAWKF